MVLPLKGLCRNWSDLTIMSRLRSNSHQQHYDYLHSSPSNRVEVHGVILLDFICVLV